MRDARRRAGNGRVHARLKPNAGAKLSNQTERGRVPRPPLTDYEEVLKMYENKSDLPETLRDYLPENLQEIVKKFKV